MGNKYFEAHEWNVFLDRTFGPLSWIYNSENVFEGSCFILKHLDRFFVVTAFHVTENNRFILIPFFYNDEDEPCDGLVKSWKIFLRENINYWFDSILDIAIIEIADIPYKGIEPVQISNLSKKIDKSNWVHYCGFTKSHVNQVRKNEKSKKLKNETTGKLLFYPFHVQQPIISFDEKYIYGEYSNRLPRYSESDKVIIEKLPKPIGLSGSAVWKFDLSNSNENPEIIGIGIEYYDSNQTIKILRSEIIIDFIYKKIKV